ncbi:MAG: tyrosine-type recombinase/integrase [Candidatus Woesearchaeota archaeon]|nr:MAG: tyrosine-type recombinase/integrase [Candidatus Woesearchaeota archaeon]
MDIFKRLEAELRIKRKSQRTIDNYLINVKQFHKFIEKDLDKVTEDDIKQYISYLMSKKYSASSINIALASLRFLYDKVLKLNIMSEIESQPIGDKLPTILSKDEIKRLLGALNNKKHKILLSLMYDSGLRVSEVVSLKKVDLELDDNSIMVKGGKGNKDRLSRLSDILVKQLREYLPKTGESPYVFPGRNGHISVSLAQKIMKQTAKKAGIKKNVYCHTLRHSFATHLLEDGVDIRIIQKLLGHSRLDTTQIYTNVSTKQLKKVKSPLDSI